MLDTMQHKTSGAALLEKFLDSNPKQAAAALESLSLNEAVFWCSALNTEGLLLCFENMEIKKAAPLLRRLPLKQGLHILSKLKADTAADLFENLPPPYKAKMAASMDKNLKKILDDITSYPKESAAGLMRTSFIYFKTDAKIKDIIARVKMMPKNKLPYAFFILDKANKYAGSIRTMDLAFCNEESLAGSVMNPGGDMAKPSDTKAEIFDIFAAKHFIVLPVVDKDGFLSGVINAEDLVALMADAKNQNKGIISAIKSRLSL